MTRSTTTYSRGDIVLVPLQLTDGSARKNRPAVIVGSEPYHRSRHEVIIAGVTSSTARRGFVGQVQIRDWQSCGLVRPSVVSGIIMTIQSRQVGHHLGALTTPDMLTLEGALRRALDL